MNAQSNLPLSEQFRIVAKEWCEADAAADLLEQSKSAFLSQQMMDQGDMPVAHAERNVKASEEWDAYLKAMCAARERANLLKVKMEWIRMRASEWQSVEATKRAEMKL